MSVDKSDISYLASLLWFLIAIAFIILDDKVWAAGAMMMSVMHVILMVMLMLTSSKPKNREKG